MGRRKSKSNKRRIRNDATPTVSSQRSDSTKSSSPSVPEKAKAVMPPPDRPALRPWRPHVQGLLDHLQSWGRANYGAAIERWLEHQFEPVGGIEAVRATDVDRVVEDLICAPGSAGDNLSILSVFADQADGPDGAPLEPEDRDQMRRWELERRRGVFLVQQAARDRLTLWDPLEGAPLTLHLMRKLGAARAAGIRRGTVVTATYQPWMARLVAVGEVEFFADERAISMFREETIGSGARWHEAPTPAPTPSARSRK